MYIIQVGAPYGVPETESVVSKGFGAFSDPTAGAAYVTRIEAMARSIAPSDPGAS